MIVTSFFSVCLGALAQDVPLDTRQAIQIAIDSARKRVEALAHFELITVAYNSGLGVRGLPLCEVHTACSESNRATRTAHFDKNIRTLDAAILFDEKLNTAWESADRFTVLQEQSRTAVITKPDVSAIKRFQIDSFLDKLFVCPWNRRQHLDTPITFSASDNRIIVCHNSDIWLPYALEAPGWEAQTKGDEIHLVRLIGDLLRDTIVLSRSRPAEIMQRRFEAGEDVLELNYYKWSPVPFKTQEVMIPHGCSWRRTGRPMYFEEIQSIALREPDSTRFDIDFPPGTIVDNRITKSRTIKDGGRELLSGVLARGMKIGRYQDLSFMNYQIVKHHGGSVRFAIAGVTFAICAFLYLRWSSVAIRRQPRSEVLHCDDSEERRRDA